MLKENKKYTTEEIEKTTKELDPMLSFMISMQTMRSISSLKKQLFGDK